MAGTHQDSSNASTQDLLRRDPAKGRPASIPPAQMGGRGCQGWHAGREGWWWGRALDKRPRAEVPSLARCRVPWRRLLPLLLFPRDDGDGAAKGSWAIFKGRNDIGLKLGAGYVQGHNPAWGQGRVDRTKSPVGCSTGQGLGLSGGMMRIGSGVLARPSFPAGARGSWLSPRPGPPPTFPSPYLHATRAGLSPAEPRNRGRKPKHGTSWVG